MAIKAVFFDLDMCIFDTRTLGERILDPVLVPLHSSVLSKEVQQKVSSALWTMSLEDVISHYQLPERMAEEMRAAHRELIVPDDIRTFGDEWVIRMVDECRVLVTSGYRAWQERKIEKLDIAPLFDEVIIDVIDDPRLRIGKRGIFARLLEEHDWHPHEVLVVGDNPNSELKAGKELGMVTVQTLRPTIAKAQGFDHYVCSLRELLPLVGEKPR